MHPKRTALLFGLLTAALASCGGTSSSTTPTQTPLTVVSVNVVPGQTWEVNRPVDIAFSHPIQFGSVSLLTLRFVDGVGDFATGTFEQPLASDGTPQTHVVRFQPTCPVDLDGSGAGFRAGGVAYTLRIAGADSGGTTLLSNDDQALEETFELTFHTPTTTNPAQLFHDPVPGPPRIVVRGLAGAPPTDARSTHLEIEPTLTQRAYFEQTLSSQPALLDAQAMAWLPDGLPLNHRIHPNQHLAFVVYFNQPILPTPENLARVRIEALTEGWQSVPGTWELLSNCPGEGTAIRFEPEAMLPRSTTLRIGTQAGFQDLTLEATTGPSGAIATVGTTSLGTGIGAQGDAIGLRMRPDPVTGETDEDLQPDFLETPAHWGPTGISAVQTTDGVSRARSRWIPLGEGGFRPTGGEVSPRFWFAGLDANGVLQTTGTQIDGGAPLFQGVALTNLQSQTIVFPKSALDAVDPAYGQQVNLLRLAEVRLSHGASGMQTGDLRVADVHDFGSAVQLTLASHCVDTGDCVPLDLLQAFPGHAGVTVDLFPRMLEVVTGFEVDRMPLDSRITITFDATRADASGAPDPLAALSASQGWQGDPQSLNGTPWDFVRIDVLFELDVSGDGYIPGNPSPKLRGLGLPFTYLP